MDAANVQIALDDKKRIEVGKGEGVIFVVVKASGSFRLPKIMPS